MQTARDIFSHRPYWAKRFGSAPFLPMSRAEMDALGWDSCDIILVTGDAYVDHPSFGVALVGRVLEAQGFRVGIISQPDWRSAAAFQTLGKPNLFFGITAGNMDSMVNRYTADRRIRSDDAYTPGGEGGKRPDRSVIVYAQRAREAYPDAPIIIGSIEASLRRIAHYDYWSEKVRRSVLLDAKADMLVYGNAERQICEIAHRLAAGEADREHHRRARHGVRARRPCRKAGAKLIRPISTDPARCVRRRIRIATEEEMKTQPAAAANVVHVHRRVPHCGSRALRDPPAIVRGRRCRSGAVRARLTHPAYGSQPRQCARTGAASW